MSVINKRYHSRMSKRSKRKYFLVNGALKYFLKTHCRENPPHQRVYFSYQGKKIKKKKKWTKKKNWILKIQLEFLKRNFHFYTYKKNFFFFIYLYQE